MHLFSPRLLLLAVLCALPLCAAPRLTAEPTAAAIAGYNVYVAAVEQRLARQHQSPASFLAPQNNRRLQGGELIVEELTPSPAPALPGAMLHHWRATAFAPGATTAGLDRLLRNFAAYPHIYAPQVERASVLAAQGEHVEATLRVRQHHVLTVVLDTDYDVVFGQLDPRHGYSLSRSTRVAEIANAGERSEHALSPADDHGFLWRQNTYWSYEERDGGTYLQIESISLTRSIPAGLGWIVRPFVESVPRESLEFTLRATCNALRGLRQTQ
ncbi:MAG TPA: hypothetical protein VE291_09300 [Terracidiphilus sp.]|jgi:hypothetical protein|nr:hypothetical protein [Terracidiphilus sp.]